MLTRLLIAANVLVYVWQISRGNIDDGAVLVAEGALYGPLVSAGEWWRVVTGEFMHGGLLHLATNMFALYQVGTFVEALYGRVRFALVYAVAIAGSGIAVLWFNYAIPTVGASGAIFGLFGALLAAGLQLGKPGRDLVQQSAGIIGINLVLGFTVFRFVSNAGHIGGLIAGFVVGYLLFLSVPRPRVALTADPGAPVTLADGAIYEPPVESATHEPRRTE